MSRPATFGAETLALHAGQSPDRDFGSRATPIHFTADQVFQDAEQAAAVFNRERPGHIDARVSNPTTAVLEERITALEGGVGAIAVASGTAALHLAVATLMGSGGHIVASHSLDDSLYRLLAHTLPRFGIRTTFVASPEPAAWRRAVRPGTRLFVGASLGLPQLDVLDIPAVSDIAHEHRVPLLVDATLVTPCLQQPLALGADLVIHSATEFLGGHGVAVGGLLVDGGRFDWLAAGGFPTLCEPDDAFPGTVFVDESPVGAFLMRARLDGLPAFGACLSPMNAFQILQGIETLPLRMKAHAVRALAVAKHLEAQPLVERAIYPGLATHCDHALAARLLPDGAGAVLAVELAGGRAAGKVFVDSLRVFSQTAGVGDAKSRALHPASTTQAGRSAAELASRGLGEGAVRLSVGLEDVDDLIEDLHRGLSAVQRAAQG